MTSHLALGQVNFSEDIAPIIYNNCTSCHRPGEIAPFSLTNYSEVASWGSMIEYVIQIGYMPPWKPDREYSQFIGESGLTPQEVQLISDWVAAGVPQGDPALEPPLPSFPSGSQLGTPDLVLEMSEDYFIQGNNQDDYRVFVLPSGLTEDKEIAAVEFRPGNKQAVHHALLAYEINGQAAALDAQSAEYGYESFGDFGVPTQGSFTGYTPGIQPIFYPEGIGITLPAGADLLMQIHYAPLPTDESDRSLLNIFFKEPSDTILREVQRARITPFDLDGGWFSFSIPPDEVKSFHGTKTLTDDISLISIYPHAHYLGTDWEIYAETPTGDTINIIRIADWDFNWQGSYTFDRMKKIPAGAIMHINATYDNTSNNPFNPNNPPQTVRWGEGTADEMYLVGTNFVFYEEGDENIVIGSGSTTSLEEVESQSGSRLFSPFPNPAQDQVIMQYYLDESQSLKLELFDVKGNLIQTLSKEEKHLPGNHRIEFGVASLAAGVYVVRMSNANTVLATKSIVVSK